MVIVALQILHPPVARPVRPRSGSFGRWIVAAAVAIAVLARLTFLHAPAGADEAGYLQVAGQWAPGGGSLYGHYWVDRPPLLITLFGLAQAAGGLVALRLLGCAAVALTVVACARTAGTLAGTRAAAWTAALTAGLLISPLVGSQEVNGELLASPFVATGIAALVEAARADNTRRAFSLALVGGAAGLGAVLVKQNIADVAVFGVVFVAAGMVSGGLTASTFRRMALGALSGGCAVLAVVAAWTVAHGTSLVAVFDAMYPFRLAAARVVAAGGSQYAQVRAGHIASAWLISGLAVLSLLLLVAVVRRRARDAALVGLAAAVVYDTVSVALGGGYWSHYLVEMVVPVAIASGVLAARGRVTLKVVAAVTVVVAAVATVTAPHRTTSAGQEIGTAIARAALPGDTLTTLYGQPDVNLAAGLPSPYPQLWSLPVKTLDPELTQLNQVLAGPRAPTWLVVSHQVASWGLATSTT